MNHLFIFPIRSCLPSFEDCWGACFCSSCFLCFSLLFPLSCLKSAYPHSLTHQEIMVSCLSLRNQIAKIFMYAKGPQHFSLSLHNWHFFHSLVSCAIIIWVYTKINIFSILYIKYVIYSM